MIYGMTTNEIQEFLTQVQEIDRERFRELVRWVRMALGDEQGDDPGKAELKMGRLKFTDRTLTACAAAARICGCLRDDSVWEVKLENEVGKPAIFRMEDSRSLPILRGLKVAASGMAFYLMCHRQGGICLQHLHCLKDMAWAMYEESDELFDELMAICGRHGSFVMNELYTSAEHDEAMCDLGERLDRAKDEESRLAQENIGLARENGELRQRLDEQLQRDVAVDGDVVHIDEVIGYLKGLPEADAREFIRMISATNIFAHTSFPQRSQEIMTDFGKTERERLGRQERTRQETAEGLREVAGRPRIGTLVMEQNNNMPAGLPVGEEHKRLN